MSKVYSLLLLLAFSVTSLFLSGCTFVVQKGRRVDVEKISRLKSELSEMERARNELNERLAREIADKEVKVELLEKGLVITFVAEVLFDSGKADIRPEARAKLQKLVNVLSTTVKGLNIGIEGHTDTEPIRHSSWKSNWELSSGRALSVLHYLVENGVASERLAAIAYGEFRPVASNDTKEGRSKNRRVEIVIIPKITKQGESQLANEI